MSNKTKNNNKNKNKNRNIYDKYLIEFSNVADDKENI